ncbi:cryptochrome/photolyase family protein [Aquabacterium sp. A08]|uniref:cryptochrome/photolyase family protein n=1 Tax=Aquabacterium sp. A08 TaxID=2718532 RepID=UPI00141EA120|nr:cryptochrome/photolyase family protein [Aquabacterium sp. A08]NIC40416.1 cryptochrome/photolyase family protein [Aquabacterium sp. A08]
MSAHEPTAPPTTAAPVPPTLRLVLGDQLNPLHPWFREVQPDVVYLLMEVRAETDYVVHHAQKVLGIIAAMRDFARQLKAAGHRVRYVALDDPSNRQSIPANLSALLAHYRARAVQYQAPDEYRLDQALAAWAATAPVSVEKVDSDHFYTPRDAVQRQFQGKRQWLMESFYRQQRRLHGVLMTADGQPEGGQWNYDADNRRPWPGIPAAPPDTRPRHDHSALWRTIQSAGVQTLGNPQADAFRWPLNRAEALQQLDHFIAHALPHFGDYQDALTHRHWHLFHSLLSFALNVKMLRPQEVVARAEQAWRNGAAPLHATEGFIRQILGWREYVRGVYWAQMPGYTEANALEHYRPLPDWFWTGQTRMACLAQAIGQSLEHAYAHHIQRLMVVGNFALLAGLDPAEVHRWYLGIYIDAFEWVEAPNTLGMSQFADGGRLATKPYVSSAAYLDRMGDHCAGCHYDKKGKTGERACPFNALYWDFFERQRDRLGRNARLAMVYRQLNKMAPDTRAGLRTQAEVTLRRLDRL